MKFPSVLLALLTASTLTAQSPCPDSLRIYDLGDVDVPPEPRNTADFMAALRQADPPVLGTGDTVQVTFVVGRDGVPAEVRLLAARDSALTVAMAGAVQMLRFTPAQRKGQPVALWLDLPVTAELDVAAQMAAVRVWADTVGTYELAAVEVLPHLTNRNDFVRTLARSYPPALRDAGEEGIVEVSLKVNADGTLGRMDVTCSTQPAFNSATLQAAQVLRFLPAQVNGRPVPVWIKLPIQWRVAREPPASPNPDAAGQPRRQDPARL